MLTIDDEEVDLSLGRVFFIDLSDDEPEYTQEDIELPDIKSGMETTADVERLAAAIIDKLN